MATEHRRSRYSLDFMHEPIEVLISPFEKRDAMFFYRWFAIACTLLFS